ncbi:hypothetical protein ACJIZ3_019082 [Penstemon smallii]|uniref:Uncharacterized protein n=1 Tax=Penstemon smallii TaxID=265156 RepID=A0ABD3T0P7_9LAMI
MKMMLSLFLAITILGVSSSQQAQTYIIHMDSTAMPKVFSSHNNWYSSIVSSALVDEKTSIKSGAAATGDSKLIYTYTNAINGFSARLTPSQLKAIQKSPAFLSSTKETPLHLATTHSSDFLGLNSMSGAWPASDFGQDVIIGVVDTGIWPESKSFTDQGMPKVPQRWRGGCFGGTFFNTSMCNNKLIGVRFFNKGFKAENPDVKNIPFIDSARDNDGHGTHVSSTAAGNYVQGASYFGYASGTSKGMAPRARLAMYKLACILGDVYPSDVIAAIDASIDDRIDILSLSFGGLGPSLYGNSLATATFSAMEKSIFISVAAGNKTPFLKTIMDMGAPWLLTVGAGTTDRSFIGGIVLGNGAYVTGISLCLLKPIPADLPITYREICRGEMGHTKKIIVCSINNDNDDFLPIFTSLEGTAVVGAVLIWNTSDVTYLPDLPDKEIGFPAVVVNAGNGKVILDYINNYEEAAKATLWFKETSHGTKPAPKVVEFSLRGPSPVSPFILKPDVIAPGNNILASWQEGKPIILTTGGLISSFNLDSGTSMASPHAAGVAALVKAVHPDWSPAAIRSAIMTTADKKGEKQSYKLRISGPCLMDEETVLYGSVSWLQQVGGNRTVTSPIVVSGQRII